jgi:hypothetical protein
MKECIGRNGVLARKIEQADMGEGLSFFSDAHDTIQVGTWVYPEGKELAPHIHKAVPRQFERTAEVLVVLKGKILASIYDEDKNYAGDWEISAGEILIALRGGHGYTVLEPSIVYEIKTGPYPGADADRERI